jgi:hypothetical protein
MDKGEWYWWRWMEINGSNRHGRKKEESISVKMKRKVGILVVFFYLSP